MRLTADEWLSRLRYNLGNVANARSYDDEAGSKVGTPLSLHVKSLTILAVRTGLDFAQFVPPGYYDTVWITPTWSVGPGINVPVYARFEAINLPEGTYVLDGTRTQHMVRHPPQISGFVNPQVGAGSGGAFNNDLLREVPLTNAPLAVWLWDGTSSWPNLDTVITCTFMTLRH